MVVSIGKQPADSMDNPVLLLQKMIDSKVSHLKDLRDKQNDNKSNVITSEISDTEVRCLLSIFLLYTLHHLFFTYIQILMQS
jgi:hypothetical protein